MLGSGKRGVRWEDGDVTAVMKRDINHDHEL